MTWRAKFSIGGLIGFLAIGVIVGLDALLLHLQVPTFRVDDLLEAVKKGINSPPVHLEKRRRPSQAYLNRLDALHEWRKKEGKLMGVQSDIILPRDVLEEIATSHPHDLQELQPLMESVPWRYDRFGRDIINVIEKRKTS